MVHKPVLVGSRVPVNMSFPLCVTVHLSLVNVAVHPASHSCPNDNRDVLPRSGNACAVRAVGGIVSKGSCPWVFECMYSLFASWTGSDVGVLMTWCSGRSQDT